MVSGMTQRECLSRNVSLGIFMHTTGRKRVIATGLLESELGFLCASSSKKHCNGESHLDSLNRLEALPQDVLIRIVCSTEHSDLKQLIFVSKTLRDAALIAKKLHFAFSTPLSKLVFRRTSDLDGDSDLDTPDAPKQKRTCKSRIHGKNIGNIAVALFANDDNDS